MKVQLHWVEHLKKNGLSSEFCSFWERERGNWTSTIGCCVKFCPHDRSCPGKLWLNADQLCGTPWRLYQKRHIVGWICPLKRWSPQNEWIRSYLEIKYLQIKLNGVFWIGPNTIWLKLGETWSQSQTCTEEDHKEDATYVRNAWDTRHWWKVLKQIHDQNLQKEVTLYAPWVQTSRC